MGVTRAVAACLGVREQELTLFKFLTEGVRRPEHRRHYPCGLRGLEEGRAAPEGVDKGLWEVHIRALGILHAPEGLQDQQVVGLLFNDSWKTTGSGGRVAAAGLGTAAAVEGGMGGAGVPRLSPGRRLGESDLATLQGT